MIWILSLAVWSISLLPLVCVFSRSKSPVWDRIDQRWRENDEPAYYYDFDARNIKRRLR